METMQDRLRIIINEKHISQRQLSLRIGKSPSFINQVLHNHINNPTSKLFDFLETRFKVNINWLMTGKGERYLPGGSAEWTSISKSTIMMHKYESLNPDQQAIVERIIDGFSAKNKM